MVTIQSLSDVFLSQNRLKKRIKEKYDLSWMEYLVLATVYKMEETYGYVATADIIIEMGLNRGSVYNAVNGLASKNYLEIAKSKNPWRANVLSTSIGGNIILSSAERLIKRRVLEEIVLQ